MQRIGFQLQVRPELLDAYKAHHAAVWPEMRAALTRHGWHNYTLFVRADGLLFGYVEVTAGFAAALAGMATEEVNARWQELMAPYFVGIGRGAADAHMLQLEEVFHLD